MVWSDNMCTATKSVDALPKAPLDDVVRSDPRFSRFVRPELAQYIAGAGPQVSSIEKQLAALAPTGIKEADEYRSSLLSTIHTVLPKLPQRDQGNFDSLPVDQLKAEAKQVAEVLAIKPQGPDLPTAAAHNPALAASYSLAPNCEPLKPPGAPSTAATPLPAASNGADVGACQSGKCQVQVSAPVDITVSGVKFTVSVGSTGVTIVDDSGYIRLSGGGTAKFSRSGGKTVTVQISGLTATTAVLDISTS
ncbi:MAG TPA: hypothetical protein VIY28_15770 [Pseudonocardiaceae bacterium]